MLLLGLDAGAAEGAPVIAAGTRADVYLAHVGDRAAALGAPLARDLRGRGLSVRFDPRGGKLGTQLGKAGKAGARFALILGDDEIDRGTYPLKDLLGGGQEPVAAADPAQLAQRVVERIEAARSGSPER